MSPYETAVNGALQDFDVYFRALSGNEPLLSVEKAVLKTFLWYMRERPEELKKHGLQLLITQIESSEEPKAPPTD